MKKQFITSLWLFILWLFVLTVGGCGSTKVDNTSISVEDGQAQITEISEQLMKGEITNEEAEVKIESIKKNMETATDALKDNYNNVSSFDWIPSWAKKLGAYELKWFDIVEWDSSVTEYSKKNHMSEAMSLVYSYSDEDAAIEVAEKLAANMGIKESKYSPRLLQANLEETMKGVRDLMSDEDKAKFEKNKKSGYIADQNKWDYYIMVSVLNGKISIIINNNAQMAEFTW